MDWVDTCRVELQNAAGTWIDITDYVKFRRMDFRAFRGRQNETDAIGAGSLQLGLDNSSGIFTPGVSSAALAITLGMPIRVFDVIGYRRFSVFTGTLEMPDSTEQLEGVDNLILVTAVDQKQLLDNGRTLVSNLAEYIMSATSTLVCYYPLIEPAAPFKDVVGSGPPLVPAREASSIADPNSAEPTYTPNSGTAALGDDVRGVLFTPITSLAGGFGTPTMARTWYLTGDFSNSGVQWVAGQPLTMIIWAQINEIHDSQNLVNFGTYEVGGFTQGGSVYLQRVFDYVTVGPTAGLLQAFANADVGTALAGTAQTDTKYFVSGGLVPFGVQISFSPNSVKLWVGTSEFTAAAPTGALSSPQRLYGNVVLGNVTGTLAHFQIHVGTYSQADFLAQARAGQVGLSGQRTDERIASILRYAGGQIPTALDTGSTYMQQATLAGKKPGQVIDEAVATERGRFFVSATGTSTFHARTRAYNL